MQRARIALHAAFAPSVCFKLIQALDFGAWQENPSMVL
jgi:hypothetical protein